MNSLKSVIISFCFMIVFTTSISQSVAVEEHHIFKGPSLRELININGSFYYISDPIVLYTVDQAITVCNDLGLKLISIQTAEKQAFAADFITTNGFGDQDFWTSGMRIISDSFIWSGTGEKFSYTNWSVGQPNEESSCMLYNRDDTWWDDLCDAPHSFICEEIKK